MQNLHCRMKRAGVAGTGIFHTQAGDLSEDFILIWENLNKE